MKRRKRLFFSRPAHPSLVEAYRHLLYEQASGGKGDWLKTASTNAWAALHEPSKTIAAIFEGVREVTIGPEAVAMLFSGIRALARQEETHATNLPATA